MTTTQEIALKEKELIAIMENLKDKDSKIKECLLDFLVKKEIPLEFVIKYDVKKWILEYVPEDKRRLLMIRILKREEEFRRDNEEFFPQTPDKFQFEKGNNVPESAQKAEWLIGKEEKKRILWSLYDEALMEKVEEKYERMEEGMRNTIPTAILDISQRRMKREKCAKRLFTPY